VDFDGVYSITGVLDVAKNLHFGGIYSSRSVSLNVCFGSVSVVE